MQRKPNILETRNPFRLSLPLSIRLCIWSLSQDSRLLSHSSWSLSHKVSKIESTLSGLFRTSKISKIDPITTENDKNEKRINFFYRNNRFSLIFLLTSDPTTTCITLSEWKVSMQNHILCESRDIQLSIALIWAEKNAWARRYCCLKTETRYLEVSTFHWFWNDI